MGLVHERTHFYETFVCKTQSGEAHREAGLDGLNELAKTLLKNKFLSPEFVFLSRTESGMCLLLHAPKSRVATTHLEREWRPAISGPEGR